MEGCTSYRGVKVHFLSRGKSVPFIEGLQGVLSIHGCQRCTFFYSGEKGEEIERNILNEEGLLLTG